MQLKLRRHIFFNFTCFLISWTKKLETALPLTHAKGTLPQKWIFGIPVEGGDPKEGWPRRAPQCSPQCTGHSHLSAWAATWRVKQSWLFSSLDCKLCSSELFSREFMLSYGFRAASGAKLKAAYCLTSLIVLWSGWPGDGRVWGCFTSVRQWMGLALLFLSFVTAWTWITARAAARNADTWGAGHRPLCKSWFCVKPYFPWSCEWNPEKLCMWCLSVTLSIK